MPANKRKKLPGTARAPVLFPYWMVRVPQLNHRPRYFTSKSEAWDFAKEAALTAKEGIMLQEWRTDDGPDIHRFDPPTGKWEVLKWEVLKCPP